MPGFGILELTLGSLMGRSGSLGLPSSARRGAARKGSLVSATSLRNLLDCWNLSFKAFSAAERNVPLHGRLSTQHHTGALKEPLRRLSSKQIREAGEGT